MCQRQDKSSTLTDKASLQCYYYGQISSEENHYINWFWETISVW
jgi:hypothetical protein